MSFGFPVTLTTFLDTVLDQLLPLNILLLGGFPPLVLLFKTGHGRLMGYLTITGSLGPSNPASLVVSGAMR